MTRLLAPAQFIVKILLDAQTESGQPALPFAAVAGFFTFITLTLTGLFQ